MSAPQSQLGFDGLLRAADEANEARKVERETAHLPSTMEEAIPFYRTYLERQPLDVDALNQLGLALAAVKQLTDAAVVFSRAAAIDPSNGTVRHNLALVLFESGDVGRALTHAREAVALQPANAESRAFLEFLQGEQDRVSVSARRRP